LSTDNGEVAHRWALGGAGLIIKSIWDVSDDVSAGKLEIVLPEIRMPSAPIQAVYPHSKHVAAKVRLCTQFLSDRLRVIERDLISP